MKKKYIIRSIIIFVLIIFLILSPSMITFSKQIKLIPYNKLPIHKNSITPVRLPMNNYIFPFPKNIEVGDLLFFDVKSFISLFVHTVSGFSNDHVIMYIGLDSLGRKMFVESNDYTFFDLNCPINGVQKTPWWVFLLYVNCSTITLGKVNASDDQKLQAIQFVLNHIGDHYQWGWQDDRKYESWHTNPVLSDPNNPFYDKYYYPDDLFYNQWTCAELVWAAYLHQGIELDGKPYRSPDPLCNNETFFYVSTNDLKITDYMTMVSPLWK